MCACQHDKQFESKASALGALLYLARQGVNTQSLEVHLCFECVTWVIIPEVTTE